jgi:hypothetical protein
MSQRSTRWYLRVSSMNRSQTAVELRRREPLQSQCNAVQLPAIAVKYHHSITTQLVQVAVTGSPGF